MLGEQCWSIVVHIVARAGYRDAGDPRITPAHLLHRVRGAEIGAFSANDSGADLQSIDDRPQVDDATRIRVGAGAADATAVVTPNDSASGQLAQTFCKALFERFFTDRRPLRMPISARVGPRVETIRQGCHFRDDALRSRALHRGTRGDIFDEKPGQT